MLKTNNLQIHTKPLKSVKNPDAFYKRKDTGFYNRILSIRTIRPRPPLRSDVIVKSELQL